MNGKTRHPFPVSAARACTRRASLLGVGGAALASVALPKATRAGKAGKKAKKKCKQQITKCQGSVTAFCAGPLNIDQETCEAAFLPCCPSFKGCKAGAAYDCIGDAILTLFPPEAPT
jgi:hypothetical protein